MISAYAAELGLMTQKISIRAQKIDDLLLETYGMVSARFSIQDNLRTIHFFEKIFLLANTSIEIVLKMPFFSFNNVDIKFAELERLIWRTYTAAEALPTTNWVKLIDKRTFAKMALDKNSETFVMYVAALKMPTAMFIHFSRISQVQGLDKPTLGAL